MSRDSLENKAARALRFWESPEIRDAWNTIYAQSLSDIETASLDGTPENDARVLELVRKHQTLVDIRRKSLSPAAQEEWKRAQQRAQENRPLRA